MGVGDERDAGINLCVYELKRRAAVALFHLTTHPTSQELNDATLGVEMCRPLPETRISFNQNAFSGSANQVPHRQPWICLHCLLWRSGSMVGSGLDPLTRTRTHRIELSEGMGKHICTSLPLF